MLRAFNVSISELSNCFWEIVIFIVAFVLLTSMTLLQTSSSSYKTWVDPRADLIDLSQGSTSDANVPVLSMEISDFSATEGRNIFFIESNINKTSFHPKLLCAFESAALQNPNYEVYVVMSRENSIASVPGYLQSITNLHLVKLDFDSLFRDSPMAKLWKQEAIQKSKYALNNISNSLRLILMYTFGGVYFDSDIILKDKIPEDFQSFIVASDNDIVNNAVLKFSKGHEFVKRSLEKMAGNYKGDVWGNQGPQLVTSVMKEMCTAPNNGTSAVKATERSCPDFGILPRAAAYALPYQDWWKLFHHEEESAVMQLFSGSFAVHYWSAMERLGDKGPRMMEADHPLYHLFEENCPWTEELELRPRLGTPY